MKYEIIGESHGPALEITLSEVPQGIALCSEDFSEDLARRRSAYGRSSRQNIEQDQVSLLAGVDHDITTGEALILSIPNLARDHKETCSVPRPGHADMWGALAQNSTDCTPVAELASARETVGRVAAGVVAKKLLSSVGVNLGSFTTSIGSCSWSAPTQLAAGLLDFLYVEAEASPVGCPHPPTSARMQTAIDEAASAGDSLGGTILLFAHGLLPSLGGYRPVSQRLTAQIGGSLFSIPTVRSVAFTNNPEALCLTGSAFHDAYQEENGKLVRGGNNGCGLEGGMTTGEPLLISLGAKPLPTVRPGLQSFDLEKHVLAQAPSPRADTCAVPALRVIAEAELALCLATAYQELSSENSLQSITACYQQQKRSIEQQLTLCACTTEDKK